jgi:DNA-binding PadR family transcriptional regulator
MKNKYEDLSAGDVRMAAGTLYGAIENLLKLKYIEPVPSEDKRRKVYVITEKGKGILKLDLKRMKHMVDVSDELL